METSVYSSTNISPFSMTIASRSTSGSTTNPTSAHPVFIKSEICVRFSGIGSGYVRIALSGRSSIQRHFFSRQRFQEFWDDNAANGIDRIDSDCEIRFPDGVDIDQIERKHAVDVSARICFVFVFVP